VLRPYTLAIVASVENSATIFAFFSDFIVYTVAEISETGEKL